MEPYRISADEALPALDTDARLGLSENEARARRRAAEHRGCGFSAVRHPAFLIEEGDAIAADARLIQSTALQTAEAALTGESMPVSKDIPAPGVQAGLGNRRNRVFSGTAATYGRGAAGPSSPRIAALIRPE